MRGLNRTIRKALEDMMHKHPTHNGSDTPSDDILQSKTLSEISEMMAFALFYGVGYAYAPVSPAPRKWDATHPSLPLSTSFPSNGTIFSAVFGDGAVLQRGSTTRAALYGAVYGATAATTVTLTIAEKGAAAYSVSAMVVPVPGGNGNVTWKALLKPHAAEGGVITATASCSSCSNTAAATLHDLTYGDVWFCSGQSNMWLPMEHSLTRNRSYAAVDATPKEYSNIRTFKRHQMVNGGARFDGDELWIYQPTDAVALKETWWGRRMRLTPPTSRIFQQRVGILRNR
jgi:hypothetical protein